jgi:hypothetical protein
LAQQVELSCNNEKLVSAKLDGVPVNQQSLLKLLLLGKP